jgi:hypothetical protein
MEREEEETEQGGELVQHPENNIKQKPQTRADKGLATKRQIGKNIGLLDRVQSYTSLTKGLSVSNTHKNVTVMGQIASAIGLTDAPILVFLLSIVFVIVVGWILRGSIGASTSGSPTYILFIQQCFTIWLWLLIILIVLNFILNIIFL